MSLAPLHQERSPVDGKWHVARHAFAIKKPFMATGPVICRKLAGWSENLGQAARREAGFVSNFELGD